MGRFIPTDPAKATALSERITTETRLSPDDFVKFYNTGLINRKNEVVEGLVQELTTVFKDVVKKGTNLTFISQEEVLLTELEAFTSVWLSAVRLKSALQEQVEAGVIVEDARFWLSRQNIRKVLFGENEELFGDRVAESVEELDELARRFSSVEQTDANAVQFRVSDFLYLDLSFIAEVHERLA